MELTKLPPPRVKKVDQMETKVGRKQRSLSLPPEHANQKKQNQKPDRRWLWKPTPSTERHYSRRRSETREKTEQIKL